MGVDTWLALPRKWPCVGLEQVRNGVTLFPATFSLAYSGASLGGYHRKGMLLPRKTESTHVGLGMGQNLSQVPRAQQ